MRTNGPEVPEVDAPPEERVLVIGATGYTGQALVEQLSQRASAQVWAHVRPDSPALSQWEARVQPWENVELSTAAWSDAAMRAELERVAPTHIFLLLGTTKARGRGPQTSAIADTYEAVDYGLTHLVLQANLSTPAPARIIYLSSLGVSPKTTNPYLKVRARIEAQLQAASPSWVSVRPSFISGPDRQESRPLERVSAIAATPLLRLAGALGARRYYERYRPRTGAELAALLIACAFDPTAHGIMRLDDIACG